MDARFIRAVETVAAGDEIGAGSVYGEVGAKLVVTLLFACRGEEALGNPHGALRRDGDTQLFF